MTVTAATLAPPREIETIALVGFAHGTSHFFHLLIPPLFPWLMAELSLSFTEAGSLMTLFFLVSGVGQAAAGFVVDRMGARRVLFFGVGLATAAGLVVAAAQGYGMLALAALIAGLGNSVFHPADFSILNHRISKPRLGHAFSVHGLSGNLGWALAPVLLTGIASTAGWRWAALAAASLGLAALGLLALGRDLLTYPREPLHRESADGLGAQSSFAFLGSPAVWLCFAFFLVATMAFGALQNFATPALQHLYDLSLAGAAGSLSAFRLGGAAGMAAGGFLAGRGDHQERTIALALTAAAAFALLIAAAGAPGWAVMPLMALMGFCSGTAGPSRDMLVRRAATERFGKAAYGRVYGFVYSGLDAGLALAPLAFGPFMDAGRFGAVLMGVALLQGLAVLTALRVGQGTGAGGSEMP